MRLHHAFACVLACALAHPAIAESPEPHIISDVNGRITSSVAVSAAGLDLATAAGRHIFDRRLREAAGAVCGAPRRIAYETSWEDPHCFHRVLRTARRQAGHLPAVMEASAGTGDRGLGH